MLKKPTLLLSYNCFHQLHPPPPTSKLRHPNRYREDRQKGNPYATTSSTNRRKENEIPHWPKPRSIHEIPTPYEIFNQAKGSPYCKKRFYELVKYYHPDHHCDDPKDGLSHSVRTERYRLIISANDILSDPVKRGAYDAYGAGWNGQPEAGKSSRAPEQPVPWGNYTYKGWGPEWEQDFTGKGRQEPRFMSNGAFLFLVLVFAAVGGFGQVTRAGNYSMTMLEQRDAIHDSMSKELMRRRRETTSSFTSREQRIHSFLQQRGPREERPMLPPPDMCNSDGVKRSPVSVQTSERSTDHG